LPLLWRKIQIHQYLFHFLNPFGVILSLFLSACYILFIHAFGVIIWQSHPRKKDVSREVFSSAHIYCYNGEN